MTIDYLTNDSKQQKETKKLVIESFQGKFSSSGFSSNEIINITQSFWSFPSLKSVNQQLIVKENEQVVGTMLLKRTNDEQPKIKKIVSLFTIFNVFNLFKLLSIFAILEHKVKENEVYIDHIVSDKHFRNHGIGSALLEKAKESVLPTEFLSLYVADTNVKAIELYKRHGFHIVNTKKSFIRKMLISEEKWHYMIFQAKK